MTSSSMRAIACAISLTITLAATAAEHAHAASADLWDTLMAGNARFVSGRLSYTHLAEQRAHVAPKQNPRVSVLSCADSRVPPELVFDKSVGDLFVVREAGNVVNQYALASLEFAVVSGYTEMIVILGHENCGAVKAALATGDPGTPALDALVVHIREAFDSTVTRGSEDAGMLFHASVLNMKETAKDLLVESETIRKAVEKGRVQIVLAWYDLDTGKVTEIR